MKWFPFIFCWLCVTALNAAVVAPSIDSIPQGPYKGYRLQIVQIKVKKEKKNSTSISCSIINTGRLRLQLGLHAPAQQDVQLMFDETFEASGLQGKENAIKTALWEEKMTLEPGEMAKNISLSVSKTDAPEPPVASMPTKSTQSEVKPSSTPTPPSSVTVRTDIKGTCPDLVIDTIIIEHQSRRSIDIKYVVSNRGNQSADLFGATPDDEDNVAIKAFFSGTDHLTKGAIHAGGTFLKPLKNQKSALLRPGETYTGTFELSLEKKSKYNPVLLLYIDYFQILQECDETNNTQFRIF